MAEVLATMADNWVYWAVSIFAIIAAYIDGKELRVPNKLTIPMIVATPRPSSSVVTEAMSSGAVCDARQ